MTSLGRASGFRESSRLLAAWFPPLEQAIEQEQAAWEAERQKARPSAERAKYGPYLVLLSAEKLAVITIGETLSQLLKHRDRVPLGTIYRRVGGAVRSEVLAASIDEQRPFLLRRLQKSGAQLTFRLVSSLAKNVLGADASHWPPEAIMALGSFLVRTMIRTARVLPEHRSSGANPLPSAELADPAMGSPALFEHLNVDEITKKVTRVLCAHPSVYEAIELGQGLQEVPPTHSPPLP